MAARMERENSEEEIDPNSPLFNPRVALYASDISLPTPDVTPFNNLAEYESFMKRKDSETQKRGKEERQKLPGIIAHKAAEQARENVRIAALKMKTEKPVPLKVLPTVLTKMEDGFEKGPLNLLKRSVKERLKVLVIVRAAVTVRSHCRGFVIAFDKHMNMALMDVDEIFLKPTGTNKTKSSEEELSTKERPQGGNVGTLEMVQVKSEQALDTDAVTTRLERLGHTVKDFQLEDSYKHRDISRPSASITHQSCHRKGKEKLNIKSEEICDRSTDVTHCEQKLETSKDSKKELVPFWPKYKDWVSNRSYGHYTIIERHINQLFIRGDNVVSVSIIPTQLVPS